MDSGCWTARPRHAPLGIACALGPQGQVDFGAQAVAQILRSTGAACIRSNKSLVGEPRRWPLECVEGVQ